MSVMVSQGKRIASAERNFLGGLTVEGTFLKLITGREAVKCGHLISYATKSPNVPGMLR